MKLPHTVSSTVNRQLVVIFLGLLAVGALCSTSYAQTTKPTDGSTPLGLQAGAPEGSYSLDGFDNVNLYNGSLNFSLPLLRIGGRGTASHTIILPIERHWMMEQTTDEQQNVTVTPIDGREEEIKPGYGPGIMAIRYGGIGGSLACEPHPPNIVYGDSGKRYSQTVTRLSFTRPDGSEIEFRDVLQGGSYAPAQLCGNHDPASIGYNRGKVFASVDGSMMTFISDADVRDEVIIGSLPPEAPLISGFLLLPDGTRYRIDGGVVSWIRDRNGNKITFVYSGFAVTSITDSLNRQVTIAYDVNEGGQYGVCDKITYKGFGGATRVIRISKTSLGSVLRSGYSLTSYGYLFSGGGGGSVNYNPTVVSSVWLPDSDGVTRSYQFQYNNYGELARVVLPTGGAYEYDFGAGTNNGSSDGLMFSFPNQQIYRRVIERRVYPDGGRGSSYASRMSYGVPESQSGSCCATTTVGYVTVEQRDGSSHLLASSKHYFSGPGAGSTLIWHSPIVLTSQMDGKETQTDVFDTDGTTVLRRSLNTWQAGTPIAANTGAPINPRVIERDTTLEPGGANLVAKQTFSYDQYNNQTDVYEYDYGTGSAGPLVRHAQTTFLTTQAGYDYACDPSSTCSSSASIGNAIHIRSLPTRSSVFDAGGIERARTIFEYDNYAADTNHAGLINRASISGLDSSFTTALVTRGNVTATTQSLLNSTGSETGSISGYAQYDIAGNVVKAIDARGHATTIDFNDCFGGPDGNARINAGSTELSAAGQYSYAFATSATNALSQTSYVQFDYYIGKPVDAEDANGVVSSAYYNDPIDRSTQAIRAANQGSLVKNQTTFSYDDVNHLVTATSDMTGYGDNLLVTKTLYDGLGRTTESRQYESGSNYIAAQTQYDAVGRAYKVSNPFRPNAIPSEDPRWTTSEFDALGRIKSVTTPADGATVTTSYSGNTVTVTDQAGKKRRSVTDALGRVVRVDEPDANGNLDVNGVPMQSTFYSYDVLGNLRQVTQGSQQRFYMYDSLSRLIRARTVEQNVNTSLNLTDPITGNSQWTAGYQYDANGNLTQKTDARGVVANYAYDALNRNTSVSYTDDPASTATVTRTYDNPASGANGLGRLWKIETADASRTTIDSYDAFGRPLTQRQQFYVNNAWGQSFTVTASYDKAGHILFQSYPSNHSITNTFDGAGRLLTLSGSLGDGVPRTYSTGISYSSLGGMKQEQFGTDTAVYHKLHYNARGQLYDIRASTVPWQTDEWNWNRGGIVNYYSTADLSCSTNQCRASSGPDNNGNVLQSQHWIPANDQMTSYNWTEDRFTYDSLNRLKSVGEYHNGLTAQDFAQAYDYDRWGNRTINSSGTSGTGINNKQFTVDTATNRLGAPAGQSGAMIYDNSGNLTTDTYSGAAITRLYDAENRMTKETQANSYDAGIYSYDGDGRRIKRIVNGVETWAIYGLGGELIAEYAANAAPTSPQKEYGYRNGELLVTAEAGSPSTNVALAANGGVVSSSSNYNDGTYSYTAAGVTNGVRSGSPTVPGEAWNAATGTFPQWLQIDFNGSKTIGEIDVFTVQDNWEHPSEPTEAMTFDNYGLTGFDVQYWNGSSWATVPGGGVTGNNKVWKKISFAAITTTKIRVLTNASPDSYSRLTEVEAWTAATASAANIHWLVSDQLGTPRMVFDQSGSLSTASRHDYLPFGEELFAGTGGRTTVQGYSASDGVRQHFTQKERDNETGLDYFLARYNSSTQGRFTSPDEFRGGPDELYLLGSGDQEKQALPYADITNPQSLNKYTYCYNNPLRYVDPDGHLGTPWHFLITYFAGVRTHHGLFHSLKLAWKNAAVDFRKGSQGTDAANTNMHAMAGTKPDGTVQTAAEARTATTQVVTNAIQSGDTAVAGHAVIDAATPAHDGREWKGYGLNETTFKHILGDLFPSPGTVKQAYENEKAVLQGTNPLATTPAVAPPTTTPPPATTPPTPPPPKPTDQKEPSERD